MMKMRFSATDVQPRLGSLVSNALQACHPFLLTIMLYITLSASTFCTLGITCEALLSATDAGYTPKPRSVDYWLSMVRLRAALLADSRAPYSSVFD